MQQIDENGRYKEKEEEMVTQRKGRKVTAG
jgi:hypothetical protein